jgi:cysteinyl-tRNA synthetase
MPLKIFNTLSNDKELFTPLSPEKVRMYVCGVTVYDSAHIGHARSFFTFDIIYRYLRFAGFNVDYVRNFTDVDDKIIKKANDEKVGCDTVTNRYIDEFVQDADSLGWLRPSREPRATEHISEIIAIIERLEAKGLAYQVGGDMYYAVSGFADYGKLSRKKIDELESGARVEVDERKRSPLDFALWKASKPGEPTWESPWGAGRPGWHIECSAMSTKYLGQPFDIHGGGRDLIFPHHENEIAQSEGAFGLPLARYWVHAGFLNINHEKMSKSLGNFFTIRDILNDFDAVALRHFFLGSHYRNPMDFSKDGLEDASKAADRIFDTIERLDKSVKAGAQATADGAVMEAFRQEMDDDFNTPRALALIFDEVRTLNKRLDEKKTEGIEARNAALQAMCNALGLLQEGYLARKKQRWLRRGILSESQIETAIRRRNDARRAKDWPEADRIRDELNQQGVAIEDTPGGTIWKIR